MQCPILRHRLHIIVIVEANMNMIMKVIWARRLVPRAEETNYISRVQFGNWKGKTVLDALLLKITTMDSLQLFRLNGALLNNDAVACYDRMIPAVLSLHLQSLGLPESAAICSVKFNKQMKHYFCTNTGESSDFYQHTEEYMKGNEGQGKSSSPPNWLFQSSTLLKLLEDQCDGLYMTSVYGKYESSCVAEGHVDDCDAVTVDQQTQDHDTPETLQEKMRIVAQTWADLIYRSGGKVLMEKSCWGLVWWLWKDGKARKATTRDITAEVKLTHGKEQDAVVLNCIEPTDAIRQLGLKNDMIGCIK
eukprot:10426576-Ditylum_brightwellii.AAC.1